MDTTNPKQFDHVLYQLEDGGSHFPIAHIVLYPRVPVPASSIPDWFLTRLLEEKSVAYCDADGNLAPESASGGCPYAGGVIVPGQIFDTFSDSPETIVPLTAGSLTPNRDIENIDLGNLTDLPDPEKEVDASGDNEATTSESSAETIPVTQERGVGIQTDSENPRPADKTATRRPRSPKAENTTPEG